MIEFTAAVEIRLIKTDLGLEEEMATLLSGGSGNAEEYYAAFLDESMLEHFSASWAVQAPEIAWAEINDCCSITPLPLRMDEEELYYVPGFLETSDDAESQLAIAHIENHTEESFQKYRDMIEAGVSEETARLVLPANKIIRKLVTMTGSELLHAIERSASGEMSTEAGSIILGLGQAFDTCSPIISSVLEGHNAFESD